MNRHATTLLILSGVIALACGGETDQPAPPATQPPATEPATEPADAGQPVAQPTGQTAPVAPVSPLIAPGGFDEEPWTPTDTGSIDPGWTAEDVIAVWGNPALQRVIGTRTYMYYRNGCERACGTYDVVMLDGNQVVDAIVRGPGHTYSGVSSSPLGRAPEFTPPTPFPTPAASDTTGVNG